MKGETNTLSVPFDTPKSLFRNIFHISPLNSKILRDFPPNPMIPIDRGGGYPQYQLVNSRESPVVFHWPCVLADARTASWQAPAAVNTLSKAVSVRSSASRGS